MVVHTTLNRQTLAEQVARALIDLILDRGLTEGDALPSTAELSERFGVSRTVVREALAALTGQGILSRGQGRDCVVSTPDSSQLLSLFQFRVRDGLDEADVMQVRLALEVGAAEAAALKRSEEHVSALRQHLASLENAPDDRRFHEADLALHRVVAEASGNPLVVFILDGLAGLLRAVRVSSLLHRRSRGDEVGPVIEAHRAIVDAIADGDPLRAAAAMRDHLVTTSREFDGTTTRLAR